MPDKGAIHATAVRIAADRVRPRGRPPRTSGACPSAPLRPHFHLPAPAS
ncbi:hypothetical protein HMPREF1550_00146 [Actinomyces sp. oral taxon 877 str. F0543]|nr:hypothetical protein HMPREF1550_00146 [Actinomyces sp. oral taxon 877 str. F0543]